MNKMTVRDVYDDIIKCEKIYGKLIKDGCYTKENLNTQDLQDIRNLLANHRDMLFNMKIKEVDNG